MGIRHTSVVRATRGVKPVPTANAGRVEWALLTALTVVAFIAGLGTAGAKALARWLGAE
jgi:hypothetical protein